MANPLKLRSDNDLQEMTNAELDYTVHQVLLGFSSTTTVSVNPGSTAGLTNIGTFVDTIRNENVGTHPASGATSSTNYTFYQDRQTQSESGLIVPLEYSSNHLNEQSDTDLNSTIVSRALSTLVNSGVGSYKLQPSSPSGGTWTNVGTVSNTLRGGSTNTTTLWKKTNATAPTTIRPIKLRSDNDLQQMTDSEIQTLVTRLRNRINDTGIGRYQLQASAPSGGTWVAAGSGFTDTRRQVANQNYSGTYAGNYAGTYTGTYHAYRAWSWQYIGSYTGSYTGYYTGYYTGTYSGATIQSSTENPSNVTLWIRTA